METNSRSRSERCSRASTRSSPPSRKTQPRRPSSRSRRYPIQAEGKGGCRLFGPADGGERSGVRHHGLRVPAEQETEDVQHLGQRSRARHERRPARRDAQADHFPGGRRSDRWRRELRGVGLRLFGQSALQVGRSRCGGRPRPPANRLRRIRRSRPRYHPRRCERPPPCSGSSSSPPRAGGSTRTLRSSGFGRSSSPGWSGSGGGGTPTRRFAARCAAGRRPRGPRGHRGAACVGLGRPRASGLRGLSRREADARASAAAPEQTTGGHLHGRRLPLRTARASSERPHVVTVERGPPPGPRTMGISRHLAAPLRSTTSLEPNRTRPALSQRDGRSGTGRAAPRSADPEDESSDQRHLAGLGRRRPRLRPATGTRTSSSPTACARSSTGRRARATSPTSRRRRASRSPRPA